MTDQSVQANANLLEAKTDSPASECVTNEGTNGVVAPVFATRFIYNSNVKPATVEAAFARKKSTAIQKFPGTIQSRTFWCGTARGGNHVHGNQTVNIAGESSEMLHKYNNETMNCDGFKPPREDTCDSGTVVCGVTRQLHADTRDPCGEKSTARDTLSDTYLHDQNNSQKTQGQVRISVNTASDNHSTMNCAKPIYDVNYCGFEDKFASEIICTNVKNKKARCDVQTPIFDLWKNQVDFTFGFVPLQEQVLPTVNIHDGVFSGSLLETHELVKATGKPNFLQARIPIQSQLNVEQWEKALVGYWDRQLLDLLKYGFPLDFNRACDLGQYTGNHSSAIEFPKDIEAYLQEELSYGALLGPFEKHPIKGGHCSPFMTRSKPNSDRHRVIVDLSWPQRASVNAGIDKASYLDSAFELTFPTVDDITSELKRLGRGAHIYKVDVSRAFRHVKVDPRDYDLLGLYWGGYYVDSCVPFGTRHGSQIFQRLSDAVRFMMRQKGYAIIDYIDDYVGVAVPSVVSASYAALLQLMSDLGLTVSQKKLVAPATQVTCLGVMIDSVNGTIAIPPEKLQQINKNVHDWLGKSVVSKRQLQSLLGLLLYIHKCVKPARIFLNRMLELLRSSHSTQRITLTSDFKRDLNWFATFLPKYNGVSLYDHRPIDMALHLDACLTGFGGRCGQFVYHLPITRGFRNWNIVHLEMVNILLAMRLFANIWAAKKIQINCDNEAVVTVLTTGKTRDAFLAACARNIWYVTAIHDIEVQYKHVSGVNNQVADILSRWQGSPAQIEFLHTQVPNAQWLNVTVDLLELDPYL